MQCDYKKAVEDENCEDTLRIKELLISFQQIKYSPVWPTVFNKQDCMLISPTKAQLTITLLFY